MTFDSFPVCLVLYYMLWVLGSAKGNPVTMDIALLEASPNLGGSVAGM
jgi:hypothetical protein